MKFLTVVFWVPYYYYFLTFINDLPELRALQDVSTKIYADGVKIYRVISQITDQFHLQAIINTINKELAWIWINKQ